MKNEWLSATELAVMARDMGIEGVPYSNAGMNDFVERFKINRDERYFRIGMGRNYKPCKLYHVSILRDFAQPKTSEWIDCKSITLARLPGFHNHDTGNRHMIEALGWRNDPRFCRRIRGKGCGFEYHISLLTDEQRKVWLEYYASLQETSDMQSQKQAELSKEDAHIPTSQAAIPDLSSVKNSALLAELMARLFKALGDADG